MIRSYRDSRTKAIARGERVKGFPPDLIRRAQNKLTILDYATSLEDLRWPPGNRLEKLSADRRDQHSMRINDQWRICFVWTEVGPDQVEIIDYH
jgi:toxin HigB-1